MNLVVVGFSFFLCSFHVYSLLAIIDKGLNFLPFLDSCNYIRVGAADGILLSWLILSLFFLCLCS